MNEKLNNQKIIKQSIALGTAIGTIASFSPEKINANENFLNLPNITLIEHLGCSDLDNCSRVINWKLIKLKQEQKNNLFFLRIHSKYANNGDIWSTDDSDKRVRFYAYDNPNPHDSARQLIVNGKSDKDYSGSSLETWPKIIDYGLENQKKMATFSLKENKETKSLELECKSIDKNILKNNNLNLIAISYQDWVDNAKPSVPDKNGWIDISYRNMCRDFPFGPKGEKIKFDKNGFFTKKFKLPHLLDYNRHVSGIVLALQDMSTKEILATGLCKFANLDGISEATYFNWNDLPENIFVMDKNGEYTNQIKKEAMQYTGLQEMTFSLNKAQDVKSIELEVYRNTNDAKMFENLGYIIHEDIKDNIDKVEFDPKTQRIKITLKEPINGDKKIFSYITHFKDNNIIKDATIGFSVKNIIITDSKGNLIYLDGNNIQDHFTNQLVVDINPLDLNEDTWVNQEDMDELLDNFGTIKKDKNFEEKYDIYPPSPSRALEDKEKHGDGRIDILDIVTLQKEINRQNELLEIVKKQNPGAVTDSNDSIPPVQLTANQKVDNHEIRSWCDQFYRRQSQMKAE